MRYNIALMTLKLSQLFRYSGNPERFIPDGNVHVIQAPRWVLLCTLMLAACGGGGGGAAPATGGGAPLPPIQGADARFDPPAFSGSFAVGKTSFHWTDTNREETLTADTDDLRELVVDVFFPTDETGVAAVPVVRDRHWATLASQQVLRGYVLRRGNYDGVTWPISDSPPLTGVSAQLPVLLFSHGGGGATGRNLFLIGELASHGYVVAAINHSYHADFVLFPDGRLATDQGFGLDGDGTISSAEAVLLADAQVLWATDQVYVLEQLLALHQDPGGVFEGRFDFSRLAATGFSLGGAAAFEAASRDSRIAAVIDLDGSIWPSGDPQIFVPMLWMQSGTGVQFEVFDSVFADAYAVMFDGGVMHLAFEDLSLLWRWDFPQLHPYGSLDSLQALRATSELMRQFLDKYLEGNSAPALDDPAATLPATRVRRFP